MEASWWERLTVGQPGSCSDGMLSKSLIQFSVDEWGCVSSLLFDLRPNNGEVNEDNGDLLQKVPCSHCCTQCPRPCSRPPPTHTSAGDSWTLTGKSGSVSCGVTAPFSWVLVHTRFLCALQESVSPILCKFCNQIPLASKVKFHGGSQSLCQTPRLGNLSWVAELSYQCENLFGVIVLQFVENSERLYFGGLQNHCRWCLQPWNFYTCSLEEKLWPT